MKKFGVSEYNPSEWRLFIDSSKRSLNSVLLNNRIKYGSLPIGHSTRMKEEYKAIPLVFENINYQEHQWEICVDLKTVNFLLGQKVAIQIILVFYAFGIVETNINTGQEKIGLRGNMYGGWRTKCNQ
jgi:hypothetical protein